MSGVHPKLLRKRLRAAGLVDNAQMANSDNNVLIDARASEDAAQEAAEAVTRMDA